MDLCVSGEELLLAWPCLKARAAAAPRASSKKTRWVSDGMLMRHECAKHQRTYKHKHI